MVDVNNSISVSVIIVSYNGKEMVADCIRSIKKFNDIGEALEIIIVDNSPNDEVKEYLSEQFIDINVIKNENTGFGSANNRGANLANGRYLLFLNPDTIIIESIFKKAIQRFEQQSDMAMFGVRLVDRNHKRNMSFYYRPVKVSKHTIPTYKSFKIKLANKRGAFNNIMMYTAGADIFIRHDIFNEAGRFDENIFMYYEEPDLSNRVEMMGKSVSYFDDIKIVHLEGGTVQDNPQKLLWRLDSLGYYCKKYGLDYKAMLKAEIRDDKFKSIIYRFLSRHLYDITRNDIEIKSLKI